MSNWEDSITGIKDEHMQWRFDFTKHLNATTRYHQYKFFWEMIPMIWFIRSKKGPAWTDDDCNIFLNIPHKDIELKNENWEFIYYHECLHQLFDTFNVGEALMKEEGNEFNHYLLNVASDCIINNYIKLNCDLDYPSDGLITPDYLKTAYGIEYDQREENQYDLYKKLKEVAKKLMDDPVVQKMREGAVDVDLDAEGSNEKRPKTVKIPTSDDWKKGSKEARKLANDILAKYSSLAQKQPNGKISVDEAVSVLSKAFEEISKMKGHPVTPQANQSGQTVSNEWYGFRVKNSSEFIAENNSPEIDENYKTFNQGWDYAVDSVLQSIQMEMMRYMFGGGGGGGPIGPDGEQKEQFVPENDPDEEAPFLPKPNTKGGGSSGSGGGDDSDNDSDGSDGSDESNGSQKSRKDKMSGNDAAKKAQEAADEASEIADEAEKSAESGNSGSAGKHAKDARESAKKAQDAANKAKEAAAKGDDATAKSEMEKAESALDDARSSARKAAGLDGSNGNIDEMSGEESANAAQMAANEAKHAAESAQKIADSMSNGQSGESGQSSSSRKAQSAARDARKSAEKAQEAADKARDAASRGDDATARSEAKKARSAASDARSSASKAAGMDKSGNGDDIDGMDANAAAGDAQKSADEARRAAENARRAAENAKRNAESAAKNAESASSGSSGNPDLAKSANSAAKKAKEAARNAESAARNAEKSAEKAQSAADRAKSAASSGDSDTAKAEAKKARSESDKAKASEMDAENAVNGGDENGTENGDPGIAKRMGHDEEVEWVRKERNKKDDDHGKDGWGKEIAEIRTYASKQKFNDMTNEDAKNVVKRYAKGIDPLLDDFVRKCKDSKELRSGIVVQTKMNKRNSSWAEKFSEIIKNTVRQKVAKKSAEWYKTFNRPNRRQGVIKSGDILKKGKKRVTDKLTISIAYFVDVSGSMYQESIDNIFKYIYSMSDVIERKYKGNAVVEGCSFKTYAFNYKNYKEIIKPDIPTRGGGTDPLLDIVKAIKSLTQSYMINVIITDGDMQYDLPAIRRELSEFAGNIVFITNDINLVSVLKPLTNMEGGDCGNKFDLITVESNFNITDKDFVKL